MACDVSTPRTSNGVDSLNSISSAEITKSAQNLIASPEVSPHSDLLPEQYIFESDANCNISVGSGWTPWNSDLATLAEDVIPLPAMTYQEQFAQTEAPDGPVEVLKPSQGQGTVGAKTATTSSAARPCQCLQLALRWHEELESLRNNLALVKADSIISAQRTSVDQGAKVLRCVTCKQSASSVTLVIIICERLLALLQEWRKQSSKDALAPANGFRGLSVQIGHHSTSEPKAIAAAMRALDAVWQEDFTALLTETRTAAVLQQWSVQEALVQGLERQFAASFRSGRGL